MVAQARDRFVGTANRHSPWQPRWHPRLKILFVERRYHLETLPTVDTVSDWSRGVGLPCEKIWVCMLSSMTTGSSSMPSNMTAAPRIPTLCWLSCKTMDTWHDAIGHQFPQRALSATWSG